MLAVAVFWVWYQRYFAYSHGMDSMEPEFDRVDGVMAHTHGAHATVCADYLGLDPENT